MTTNDDAGGTELDGGVTDNNSENSTAAASTQAATDAVLAENAGGTATSEPAKKAKRRKPLITSITQRTTINYVLFAVILLVLLWAVFFSGLYGFYGKMIEREVEEAAQSAASAFPKRFDDNSMDLFYKARLSEIARANKPVSIAVFDAADGEEYKVRIFVDGMGNDSDVNTELFDSVMAKIDLSCVFKHGKSDKVSTEYGTYLCRGSSHKSEEGNVAYLLVIKLYEVFNPQTTRLLRTLIICTIIVLMLACLFSLFASRYQTKRLKNLSNQAKRLAAGDYDVVFSGDGYEEYESLASALNAATENMQKAENLQRDFVANVSHDIRTPLTMIRAYAEMLRDMPMDEQKRQKTADVIITEADRLTALTNDVLDYSRLQSGVTEFKPDKCDLSAEARAVLERFDIARSRDGIKLLHDIDDDVTVNCDKQKIEQVLYNLLNNAINYCGDDKTVILRLKKQNGKARIEVTDHGRGIEADELEAVWDRYYRAAHSKRTVVGSGLGLSICKSILIMHSAEYGVISEIGKGSTFWFELAAV